MAKARTSAESPLEIREPLGTPPSIEWCAIASLAVDESYQRSMEHPMSERLIRSMAEGWDWRLCAPLTVSKRNDDSLYVIDGQHRLEAARMRGDIPHLPAIISRFSSLEEEAKLFVAVNTVRKTPTALDKFHARCIVGEPEALEIKELAEMAGLKIGRSPYKIYDGEICAVAVLAKCLRNYGRIYLSAALVNMAEAYPNEPLRAANELVPGICYLLMNADREFDPDLFAEVLAMQSQVGWIMKGAHMNGALDLIYPDEAFAGLFVEAYNERERADA